MFVHIFVQGGDRHIFLISDGLNNHLERLNCFLLSHLEAEKKRSCLQGYMTVVIYWLMKVVGALTGQKERNFLCSNKHPGFDQRLSQMTNSNTNLLLRVKFTCQVYLLIPIYPWVYIICYCYPYLLFGGYFPIYWVLFQFPIGRVKLLAARFWER